MADLLAILKICCASFHVTYHWWMSLTAFNVQKNTHAQLGSGLGIIDVVVILLNP